MKHARAYLKKLGGRGQCPACLRQMLPGQKTVLHQGRRHHKSCVEYERRV
jgi:hypothetical protein